MYVKCLGYVGIEKRTTSSFARMRNRNRKEGIQFRPRLSLCLYACHEYSVPSSFPDAGIKVELERKPLFELAVAGIRRMQVEEAIPTPPVVTMKDGWG